MADEEDKQEQLPGMLGGGVRRGGGICRWLDESDGETGIEQELILSDILVADEEDKQEQLPGMLGGGVRQCGGI